MSDSCVTCGAPALGLASGLPDAAQAGRVSVHVGSGVPGEDASYADYDLYVDMSAPRTYVRIPFASAEPGGRTSTWVPASAEPGSGGEAQDPVDLSPYVTSDALRSAMASLTDAITDALAGVASSGGVSAAMDSVLAQVTSSGYVTADEIAVAGYARQSALDAALARVSAVDRRVSALERSVTAYGSLGSTYLQRSVAESMFATKDALSRDTDPLYDILSQLGYNVNGRQSPMRWFSGLVTDIVASGGYAKVASIEGAVNGTMGGYVLVSQLDNLVSALPDPPIRLSQGMSAVASASAAPFHEVDAAQFAVEDTFGWHLSVNPSSVNTLTVRASDILSRAMVNYMYDFALPISSAPETGLESALGRVLRQPHGIPIHLYLNDPNANPGTARSFTLVVRPYVTPDDGDDSDETMDAISARLLGSPALDPAGFVRRATLGGVSAADVIERPESLPDVPANVAGAWAVDPDTYETYVDGSYAGPVCADCSDSDEASGADDTSDADMEQDVRWMPVMIIMHGQSRDGNLGVSNHKKLRASASVMAADTYGGFVPDRWCYRMRLKWPVDPRLVHVVRFEETAPWEFTVTSHETFSAYRLRPRRGGN